VVTSYHSAKKHIGADIDAHWDETKTQRQEQRLRRDPLCAIREFIEEVNGGTQ
jgi:hypothetical protein